MSNRNRTPPGASSVEGLLGERPASPWHEFDAGRGVRCFAPHITAPRPCRAVGAGPRSVLGAPERLGSSIAGTLAGALAAGYLHGDVKPGNIGLTAGGSPKLLDFGLVREANEAGSWAGPLRYASPEVLADGESAPPASGPGPGPRSPPAAFAASVLSALRPLRPATAEAFGAALRDAVAENLHFFTPHRSVFAAHPSLDDRMRKFRGLGPILESALSSRTRTALEPHSSQRESRGPAIPYDRLTAAVLPLALLVCVLVAVGVAETLGAAAGEAALALDRPTRRLIQQGLRNEGFDPGTPDGLFGPRTRAAIRDWQQSRGASATGYLNGAEAELLRTAATNTEPMSRAPPGSANAQLPPDILVDRHLLLAERLLVDGDLTATLEAGVAHGGA